MYEEDEEDRLLIDDNEQTEVEKSKESPQGGSVSGFDQDRKTSPTMNGFNSSREEGELDDDEMETSTLQPLPVKKTADITTSPGNDRKRVNGDVKSSPSESEVLAKKSKLAKVEKRDQGTCVHTEATQADTDEPVFEMEPGSSFPLQLTVVCRVEGTDTLYFSAKYKDRELSGLLTDGEPPGFTNFAKKRAALNNNSASEIEKASISTPKKRIQRGQETKKKSAKAEDDDDDLDVTGLGDMRDGTGGSIKLIEVNSQSLHYCPADGCEHAYPKAIDLEYHIATLHKKKSVIYEHNSTQTQTEGAVKTMVSVQTDTDGLETKMEIKEELMKEFDVPKVKGPGSHYSDISDDVAPVLSKMEEPAANGIAINPSTSSTVHEKTPTPQAAVVQPTHVVPPVTASPRAQNGLLVPAPNFVSPFSMPCSSTLPGREVGLKNVTATSDSVNRPIASPAQNRSQSFNPMMAPQGAGSSQSLQQAQQAQQYQMMQHMQQMAALQHMMGGRGFPMPTDMQQMAALQALQAQGAAGFQMFPKH